MATVVLRSFFLFVFEKIFELFAKRKNQKLAFLVFRCAALYDDSAPLRIENGRGPDV
jgi:hypothetical protein